MQGYWGPELRALGPWKSNGALVKILPGGQMGPLRLKQLLSTSMERPSMCFGFRKIHMVRSLDPPQKFSTENPVMLTWFSRSHFLPCYTYLFEVGKGWKSFECREANIDKAEAFQVLELGCETFNLCGSAIVQIQLFNLKSKQEIYIRVKHNLSWQFMKQQCFKAENKGYENDFILFL